MGHLFYATSSFVRHFVVIGEFKLELQSRNVQFGSKSTDDLHKQLGTPSKHDQVCASFHCHVWIQTGVTVWKRLSWVITSVTSNFDLWPWPFAWTPILSMVITSENFMMIWWQEQWKGYHRQTDGQTDGRTDGRTEPFIELLGRS